MNCKTCQSDFVTLLLDAEVSPMAAEHLASCGPCAAEFAAFKRTFDLLDAWEVPEPSPYFDQKLAVLLREERANPAAGWLERLHERLLFNTGRQFRPAMAGVLALILVLGGGTFAGISNLTHPSPPMASATVNDLQILDKNEEAIQQMNQLLQDDDSGSSATDAQPAS